jgi:hypothetical protein
MTFRYFAVFDTSGFPTAFYNDDISPSIPDGTVEISEEQWQDFVAHVGLRKWDAATATVVEYVPPPPPVVPQTVFAPREFFALFTTAEQSALFTARRTSVDVDMFITLAMAGPVDISHAEVIADVNACVSAGILTSGRAADILAGKPAPTA